TFALLGLYLLFVELVRHYEWHRAWIPEEDVMRRGTRAAKPEAASHGAAHASRQAVSRARSQAGSQEAAPASEQQAGEASRGARPLPRLVLATVGVAIAAAAAGVLLSRVGDAVAEQAGLGASLAGLLLGGIATSLPEASTIYAAVRIRRFE